MPYRTVRNALTSIDNGGRFYNLLTKANDGNISTSELGKVAGSFSDKQKREAYERQKGICEECKQHFELNEMEADHIDPWHSGGKTTAENCQMLCREDNRRKSGK